VFRNRNRTGAYLTMLLLAIGPMGTFYVITLHLQQVLGYSPLRTGLAWLPFAVGIVLGAGIAPKLLIRTPERAVAAAGGLTSAVAALWLSGIGVDTSYWAHLAPAMVLLAFGFGLGVMALTQAAVYDVDEDKAGIAAALLNSAQQIGVALGLAVLAGVAASVTATSSLARGGAALVDGYSSALLVAGGVLIASAVTAVVRLSGRVRSDGSVRV
jgi:predicted MFS family arabinose efflux permease